MVLSPWEITNMPAEKMVMPAPMGPTAASPAAPGAGPSDVASSLA